MTPLHINILLDCYTRSAKIENQNATGVIEVITYFLDNKLIKLVDTNSKGYEGLKIYHTTDKGHAYVQLLCQVKMPILVYVGENGEVIK